VGRQKIPVIWNVAVEKITGKEKVRGAKLRNTHDGVLREESASAVFVSIEEEPDNERAVQVELHLREDGSVKTDRKRRTNIPRIYAAGDITGGVRQMVTAVSKGGTAAISAFEDISSPYWVQGKN
jgi:thioredoxin reductase (NADPH)